MNNIYTKTVRVQNLLAPARLIDEINNTINNADIPNFIEFAKKYNIFQESTNAFYLENCEKIKKRCIKDNISLDLIKPEGTNNV